MSVLYFVVLLVVARAMIVNTRYLMRRESWQNLVRTSTVTAGILLLFFRMTAAQVPPPPLPVISALGTFLFFLACWVFDIREPRRWYTDDGDEGPG